MNGDNVVETPGPDTFWDDKIAKMEPSKPDSFWDQKIAKAEGRSPLSTAVPSPVAEKKVAEPSFLTKIIDKASMDADEYQQKYSARTPIGTTPTMPASRDAVQPTSTGTAAPVSVAQPAPAVETSPGIEATRNVLGAIDQTVESVPLVGSLYKAMKPSPRQLGTNKTQPAATQPAGDTSFSPIKQFASGASSGVLAYGEAVGQIGEYAGKLAGATSLEKAGAGVGEVMEGVMKPFSPAMSRIEDIKTWSDFGNWASWNVGQMVGQIIPMIPTMGIGTAGKLGETALLATAKAAAAKAAGAAGAEELIQLAAKATAKASLAASREAISSKSGWEVLSAVLKAEPGAGEQFGKFLGNWARLKPTDAPIGLLETGQIFGGQLEALKKGEIDELHPIRGLAAAFVATKLESLGDVAAVERMFKGIGGKSGSLIANVVKGALGTGSGESLEEFFQTYAEQFGIDPKDIFSRKQFMQAVNGAAAGFAGGTVIGGVTGAANRKQKDEYIAGLSEAIDTAAGLEKKIVAGAATEEDKKEFTSLRDLIVSQVTVQEKEPPVAEAGATPPTVGPPVSGARGALGVDGKATAGGILTGNLDIEEGDLGNPESQAEIDKRLAAAAAAAEAAGTGGQRGPAAESGEEKPPNVVDLTGVGTAGLPEVKGWGQASDDEGGFYTSEQGDYQIRANDKLTEFTVRRLEGGKVVAEDGPFGSADLAIASVDEERAATPEAKPPVAPIGEAGIGAGVFSTIDGKPFREETIALDRIGHAKEVPNFKKNADPATGIVEGQQLSMPFDELGASPVILWERLNGDLQIATGRHRLDLANRTPGKKTIKAHIVREADGFKAEDVAIIDAEQNIKDQKGTGEDHARYFRYKEDLTEDIARQRGLLSRAEQRSAWQLGKYATDTTFDAFTIGPPAASGRRRLTFDQAAAISEAVPRNEALQGVGVDMIENRKISNPIDISNFLKALSLVKPTQSGPTQGDLFGYDDSAINASRELGKKARAKQTQLAELYAIINAAVRREGALKLTPEEAQKHGITDINDMAQLTAARQRIREEMSLWKSWETHPELIATISNVGAAERVDQAAAEADPNPPPGKIESGTYKKGHPDPEDVHGLKISIQTAKGETRRAADGSWEVVMPFHYGHVLGTVSKDGEPVDVTIGDHPESDRAFVIDQQDPKTQKFDEPKSFVSMLTADEARDAYERSFGDGSGPSRMMGITEMSIDEFKEWLKKDHSKRVSKAEPPADRRKDAVKRKAIAESGAAPVVSRGDRRKDAAKRKAIADMSPEEMAVELLTDRRTGLLNERAFDEAPRKAFQMAIDGDSLGAVNDAYGHATGDDLIMLWGAALQAAGIEETYHFHGDEFWMEADSQEALETAREAARAYLVEYPMTVEDRDGNQVVFQGGLSFGIAPDKESADKALYVDKEQRLASGERSDKGLPPPVTPEIKAAGTGGARGPGAETQDEISARLRAQNEMEAEFEYRKKHDALLSATAGEKAAAAENFTQADAERFIADLDAAPGDDPTARQALIDRFPEALYVPHDDWENNLFKARAYAAALKIPFQGMSTEQIVAAVKARLTRETPAEAPAETRPLNQIVGDFVDKRSAEHNATIERLKAEGKTAEIPEINRQVSAIIKMDRMRHYNEAALNSPDGLSKLPQWLQDEFAEYRANLPVAETPTPTKTPVTPPDVQNTVAQLYDQLIAAQQKSNRDRTDIDKGQKDKNSLRLGMESNRIKKHLQGTPTSIELKDAIQYLDSNHEGKIVMTPDGEGTATGKVSFGNPGVNVKGTVKYYSPDKLTAPKATETGAIEHLRTVAEKDARLHIEQFGKFYGIALPAVETPKPAAPLPVTFDLKDMVTWTDKDGKQMAGRVQAKVNPEGNLTIYATDGKIHQVPVDTVKKVVPISPYPPRVNGKRNYYELIDPNADKTGWSQDEKDRSRDPDAGATPEEEAVYRQWLKDKEERAGVSSGGNKGLTEAGSRVAQDITSRVQQRWAEEYPDKSMAEVADILRRLGDSIHNKDRSMPAGEFLSELTRRLGIPNKYAFLAKILNKLDIPIHLTTDPSADSRYIPGATEKDQKGVLTSAAYVQYKDHRDAGWIRISYLALAKARSETEGYPVAHLIECFVHEAIHGIVRNSPGWEMSKPKFEAFRQTLRQHQGTAPQRVRDYLDHSDSYEIDEVIAEAYSDGLFAQWLDSIPADATRPEGQTLWGKLKELIFEMLKPFGIEKTKLDELSTLLDEVMAVTTEGEYGKQETPTPPGEGDLPTPDAPDGWNRVQVQGMTVYMSDDGHYAIVTNHGERVYELKEEDRAGVKAIIGQYRTFEEAIAAVDALREPSAPPPSANPQPATPEGWEYLALDGEHSFIKKDGAFTIQSLAGSWILYRGDGEKVIGNYKTFKEALESARKSAAPESAVHPRFGKLSNPNTVEWAKVFLDKINTTTDSFDKNTLKRIVAEELGVTTGELTGWEGRGIYNHKAIEEAFEYALVQKGRDIINKGGDILAQVIDLYRRQPRLATRTSGSMKEQQYSTPIPIAWIMNRYLGMTGINSRVTVYEPTAGNGALLIGANPKLTTANELSRDFRLVNLRDFLMPMGGQVNNYDATSALSELPNKSVDRVVANPPFGKHPKGEKHVVFDNTFVLSHVDHLIVGMALKAMKDNGRAAFIIGGHNLHRNDQMAMPDRIFFNWLYKYYNVTHNVDIDGELYSRQGSGFDFRVITIDGKRTELGPEIFRPEDAGVSHIESANTFEELNSILERGLSDERLAAENGDVGSGADRVPVGAGEGGSDQGGHIPVSPAVPGGVRNVGSGGVGELGGQPDNTPPVGESREGTKSGNDQENGGLGPGGEPLVPVGGVDQRPQGGKGRRDLVTPGSEGDDAIKALNDLDVPAFMPPDTLIVAGMPAYEKTEEEKYYQEKVIPELEKMGRSVLENSDVEVPPTDREFVTELKGKLTKYEALKKYILRWMEEEFPAFMQLWKDSGTFQVDYAPMSGGPRGKTKVPKNMAQSIQHSLQQIVQEHGNIDDWVMGELQYADRAALYKAYDGGQVDAIALGMSNLMNHAAAIIGDSTGVGKGRVLAGLIRWANKLGKIPIFVTEKGNLFSDIYRDLINIDHKILPFVMNNDKSHILDQNTGEILVNNGFKDTKKGLHGKGAEAVETFIGKTGKPETRINWYLIARDPEGYLRRNGFKAVFTTYSQHSNASSKLQDAILERLGENNIFLLDESHNAAGSSKGKASNVKQRFTHLLDAADGVVYSSATFAKTPNNMGLYNRTSIGDTGMTDAELAFAITRGGTPLQEYMSSALARMGQYIRRELDFTGVNFFSTDTLRNLSKTAPDYENKKKVLGAKLKKDTRIVDDSNEVVRRIMALSKAMQDDRPGLLNLIRIEFPEVMAAITSNNRMSADTTLFASVVHNFTGQLLTGIKTQQTIDEAKKTLAEGKKVVINLSNTMGSFIEDLVKQGMAEVNKPIDFSFKGVLDRALRNTLRLNVRDPGGKPDHRQITPAMLQRHMRRAYTAYEAVLPRLERYDGGGLHASPIDYILSELGKASGKPVMEMTGRKLVIDYDDSSGKATLKNRSSEAADRQRAIRFFNTGLSDVIIINAAGSVGISLHASETFRNTDGTPQKPRRMLLLQPSLDINVFMQALGRIFRNGQLELPDYLYITSDLPMEIRPNVNHARKMKSLKANTTSKHQGAEARIDVPDMMNHHGDAVTRDYLERNQLLAHRLGFTPVPDGLTYEKASGRISTLPVALQEDFYVELEQAYNDLIAELDAMGENDLKSVSKDYKARTSSKHVLSPATGMNPDDPFTGNSYVERMDVRQLKKPYNTTKIQSLIATALKGNTGTQHSNDLFAEIDAAWREHLDEWSLKLPEKYPGDDATQATALAEKTAQLEEDLLVYRRLLTAPSPVPPPVNGKRNWYEFSRSNFDETQLTQEERDRVDRWTGPTDAEAEAYRQWRDDSAGSNSVRQMKIGSTYTFPYGQGSSQSRMRVGGGQGQLNLDLTGVLVDIIWKPGSGSPLQPSKLKFVFSVTDPISTMLFTANQSWFVDEKTFVQDGIPDDWDSNINEGGREEKVVVTGNMMQAINHLSLIDPKVHYEIVNFTRNNGTREFGLVIARQDEEIVGRITSVAFGREVDWEAAFAHLSEQAQSGERYLASTNNDINIQSDIIKILPEFGGGTRLEYAVRIPGGQKGQKYGTDQQLLALIRGNNFRSHGPTRMVGTIADTEVGTAVGDVTVTATENLRTFMQILHDKHGMRYIMPNDQVTVQPMPYRSEVESAILNKNSAERMFGVPTNDLGDFVGQVVENASREILNKAIAIDDALSVALMAPSVNDVAPDQPAIDLTSVSIPQPTAKPRVIQAMLDASEENPLQFDENGEGVMTVEEGRHGEGRLDVTNQIIQLKRDVANGDEPKVIVTELFQNILDAVRDNEKAYGADVAPRDMDITMSNVFIDKKEYESLVSAQRRLNEEEERFLFRRSDGRGAEEMRKTSEYAEMMQKKEDLIVRKNATYAMSISFTDHGIGMTSQIISKNFTKTAAAGTKGAESSGAQGIGKAVILGWPTTWKLLTVAIDPKTGEKVQATLEGSSDAYISGALDKAPIHRKKVDSSTPTGSTFTFTPPNRADFDAVHKQIMERMPYDVLFKSKLNVSVETDDYVIGDEVRYTIWDGSVYAERQGKITNVYSYSKDVDIGTDVSQLPTKAILGRVDGSKTRTVKTTFDIKGMEEREGIHGIDETLTVNGNTFRVRTVKLSPAEMLHLGFKKIVNESTSVPFSITNKGVPLNIGSLGLPYVERTPDFKVLVDFTVTEGQYLANAKGENITENPNYPFRNNRTSIVQSVMKAINSKVEGLIKDINDGKERDERDEFEAAMRKVAPIHGVDIFAGYSDDASIQKVQDLVGKNKTIVTAMAKLMGKFRDLAKNVFEEDIKVGISFIPHKRDSDGYTMGFRPHEKLGYKGFFISIFQFETAFNDHASWGWERMQQKDKATETYMSIPRPTFMWTDMVENKAAASSGLYDTGQTWSRRYYDLGSNAGKGMSGELFSRYQMEERVYGPSADYPEGTTSVLIRDEGNGNEIMTPEGSSYHRSIYEALDAVNARQQDNPTRKIDPKSQNSQNRFLAIHSLKTLIHELVHQHVRNHEPAFHNRMDDYEASLMEEKLYDQYAAEWRKLYELHRAGISVVAKEVEAISQGGDQLAIFGTRSSYVPITYGESTVSQIGARLPADLQGAESSGRPGSGAEGGGVAAQSNPFDYQDSNQEKVIHSGWRNGNNYRFVLEGTGDIFRALAMRVPDPGYIGEKIDRIIRHIKDERRGIHHDDSFETSRRENPEKFAQMLDQWQNQPTTTDAQGLAVQLNKEMLHGNFLFAERVLDKIEKIIAVEGGELVVSPMPPQDGKKTWAYTVNVSGETHASEQRAFTRDQGLFLAQTAIAAKLQIPVSRVRGLNYEIKEVKPKAPTKEDYIGKRESGELNIGPTRAPGAGPTGDLFAQYAVGETTPGTAKFDLQMVQDAFPGQSVVQNGENFTLTLKNGEKAIIYGVAEITPNAVSLSMGYKGAAKGKTIIGAFAVDAQGRAVIRVVRDNENAPWTLAHESVHLLVHLGIISKSDLATVSAVSRKEGKWDNALSSEENQANWLADFKTKPKPKQTVLAEIWQKIQDFISRIVGIRTAATIGREFASGEMFNKEPRPVLSDSEASSATKEQYALFGKKKTASTVTSLYPEVEKQMEESRGIKEGTLAERAADAMKSVKEHFTRHFQHIDSHQHGAVVDILRRFEDMPVNKRNETSLAIDGFIRGFNADEKKIFERTLILRDMIRNIKEGTKPGELEEGTLQFGYENRAAMEADLKHFEALANKTPKILKAMERRNAYVKDLVDTMLDLKILNKDLVNDPQSYYHHQVLVYRNYQKKNWGMASGDVREHTKGFQIGRNESTDNFNTNYVEAEFEWISQALMQIETVKVIKQVQDMVDLKPYLEAVAKETNLAKFYEKIAASGKYGPLEDPLAPYKQKMAIAFSRIAKAVIAGDLSVPAEFDDLMDHIVEQEESRKAAKVAKVPFEPESHPLMFALLNYLANHDGPGTIPALTIFKALGEKNAFIKETVGKDWVGITIPAGYKRYKPQSRPAFYFANTIQDRVLDKVLEGERSLFPTDVRKVLALRKDEEWIIPEGIAKTLDEFRPAKADSFLEKASKDILKLWKGWILTNPFRAVPYNLNNLSGDIDITLAYDPMIVWNGFRPAVMTLWAAAAKKATKEQLAELKQWTDGSLIQSGMTSMDIPDLSDPKSLKALTDALEGRSESKFTAWYSMIKRATVFRENILRLAAGRYFLERIKQFEAGKGEMPYGASKSYEVDSTYSQWGKKNPYITAAKLARELIGDYGNISHAGHYIRERLIPFWSFQEINAPRYIRLFRNLKHEGMSTKGFVGTMAFKGSKLGIKALALMGMIILWNATMFPDEEDELQETGREQLHLILGRRKDGSIITIRFQGALSDALAWIGLSNPLETAKQVVKGKKSPKDLAIDIGKASLMKIGQGLRPEAKVVAESLMGQTLYPDPFKPRPIRDTTEHILKTFSLDKIFYPKLVGKPMPGGTWQNQIVRDITSLVGIRDSDPGEQAYYTSRKYVFDWLEKQGKDKPPNLPSNRSNTLYYYRQALKFGDFDSAAKYLKKYQDMGGKMHDVGASIKRVHPLSSLKLSDRFAFKKSLSPEQDQTLTIAVGWYKKHYIESSLSQRRAAAGNG